MLERVSDGVRLAELDDGYTDLDADRLASPMSAPEGALTTLVLTMDHPMHHATRGWVHAGELAAGDRLTGDEVGETFRVVSVDFTAARTLGAAPSLTYNLTVADTHTYFVGEDGVLVHNGKNNGGAATAACLALLAIEPRLDDGDANPFTNGTPHAYIDPDWGDRRKRPQPAQCGCSMAGSATPPSNSSFGHQWIVEITRGKYRL